MKYFPTKMYVLHTNGDVHTVDLSIREFPGLAATEELVLPHLKFQVIENGRLKTIKPGMQYVSVLYGGKPCSMFVDDEGMVRGRPINARASAVYWTHVLQNSPTADPVTMNAIYGPALLFDRVIWN